MKSIAAIHQTYGNPAEVLNPVEVEIGEPKSGEVLIKLLRASVNPSDMGMIGGSYGRLRTLPAVAGREGVGRIEKLGEGVENFKIGDIVRIPEEPGVWAQYHIANAANLLKLPSGLDLDMLAMAFVNPPTALCILNNFCDLKQGDWLIQNGAGSALGNFMIQLCAARGINTINLLRNASAKAESLKKIGAILVIDESEFEPKNLKTLTDGKLPKLGLNQIGGESVSNMIKAMDVSGTIVTVGAMTSDLVRFPTRFLIFNDLRLRGFWWDKWQKTHSKEEIAKLFNEIFALIKDGTLRAPVDKVFKLSDIKSAMQRAQLGGRNGKVMLEA